MTRTLPAAATVVAAATTVGFLACLPLPCVALPRAAAVLAPACALAGGVAGSRTAGAGGGS